MVAGIRLALVLRAKGGSNLLIQAHGINGRAAQDASNEVASVIAKFAATGSKGDFDGTGDNPPGLGIGHLAAVQRRYSVTYRLVNAVYVMVVAPPASNVFLAMQLLDAVAKVLVGISKGVDVTPDKLAKRYTEVYMLLEDLVATGLTTLPPAFMHSSATDERLLVLPASAADAARRLKRMVRGGSRGANNFVTGKGSEGGGQDAGSDPTPPPVPETPSSRGGQQFSASYADPLGTVAFDIPPDALPPPPARAAVARRPAGTTIAAPQRPTPPPPAFKGATHEDASKALEAEGFGAFGDVSMLEAGKAAASTPSAAEAKEEWAQFGNGEAGFTAAAALPGAVKDVAAPAEPTKPMLPAITAKDVQASLQLTEVWRAEVAGGVILRAGVEGGVRRKLAPYGLSAALFRLLPAPVGVVNACLSVAAMNREFTEQLAGSSNSGADKGSAAEDDVESAFLAKFTQASVGCCYLQYTLPAIACPPPLQAVLHVVPGSDPVKPSTWQGLVVLRYVASPLLPGSLLDVTVDLNVPPEAAALMRVTAAAQWSRDACQLRWSVPRIPPGAAGELRAVLGCKAGVAAAAATVALQRQAEAHILFSVRPGMSLSGLGLQVASMEPGAAYMGGNAQCYGELVVRV